MGNEIVAARSAELFSFNGKYSVAEGNSPTALLDDASIFLSSAIDIFIVDLENAERLSRSQGDNGLGQRLWGAYHLFQMAKGALDAANGRLHQDDANS